MPKLFKLHEIAQLNQMEAGAVVTLPIIGKNETRKFVVRDISYSAVGRGSWPSHVEKTPEIYVILQGSVVYDTGTEMFTVNAGEAIMFDIGDQHATRIDHGIISLGINLVETH
ncbi:MAG: cupin domain-containing protein [Planctomycetota bacterium]